MRYASGYLRERLTLIRELSDAIVEPRSWRNVGSLSLGFYLPYWLTR
jgi:hypothetical protein